MTITQEAALAIAAELTAVDTGSAWAFDPTYEGNEQHIMLVNHSDENAPEGTQRERLFLYRSWNTPSGRATVDGVFCPELYRLKHYDEVNPETGFALNRDARAIAKQIMRNVLPEYRELLATLRERHNEVNAARSAEDRLAGELNAIFPGIAETDRDNRRDGEVNLYCNFPHLDGLYLHSGGFYGYRASPDAEMTLRGSMTLRGLNEEQLKAVVQLLASF
jgi:hypothetical protein